MLHSNLILALIFLLTGCKESSTKERILFTTHFKIFYTPLDDNNVQEIADSLEKSYPRITTHLQSGELPMVNVQLYVDGAALNKANPNIPSWAVGLATSVSQIHIVSPNNTQQDYQNMIRNIIHEFAHCVSMKINPTIANNPRWLWETVADYEGNLPWDPKMLQYLVDQNPPSFNELNQFSNTRIYEVGHFIGQYIQDSKGGAGFKALILNNGNVRETFGLSDEEFTKAWFEFVKKKYGI